MTEMTRAQYDALVGLAVQASAEAAAELRDAIDEANGISRHILIIRWQDVGGTQPRRIESGSDWPPETTYRLELERAISRQDVMDVLNHNASNPVGTQVTPDPDGNVGWSLLEDYTF